MKKLTLCALLCAALMSSGCAADLKNFQDLNRSLTALANGSQSTPMFSQNLMSPNVINSFSTKLAPATNDQVINANWEALIPLASKVIGLAACGVGPFPQNGAQDEIEAWKSLGRWIDPDEKNPLTYGTFPLAIWHTQYHPKSSCMSILRTDRWAKPSRNTLTFRVQFVSDSSDETVYINYLFKAMYDNAWIFTRAYM